jgi:hypothetical protein
MMLVAVCSLKGSPGVTTFCVALLAHWPAQARCLLLECDPSGGDLATRFSLASSPGLVSLAAAARRGSEPNMFWQHTQELPGGLSVVAAPPGADHALAALAALAPNISASVSVLRMAAGATDMTVIADCGRIDPTSTALPIVHSADAMVLLTRAHADDLAHVATRLTAISRWSPRPALLLVGDGYSTAEVSRELDVPIFARVPEDGPGAAVLRGHRRSQGRLSRSPLGRAASNVARTLLANLTASPRRTPASRPALVPCPEPAGHTEPVNGVPAAAPMPRLSAATTPNARSQNGRAS